MCKNRPSSVSRAGNPGVQARGESTLPFDAPVFPWRLNLVLESTFLVEHTVATSDRFLRWLPVISLLP